MRIHTETSPVNYRELYERFMYHLTIDPDGHYVETLFQQTVKTGPSANSTTGGTVTMRNELDARSEGTVCVTEEGLLFVGAQRMRHKQSMDSTSSGLRENVRDYPDSAVTTSHEYLCDEERGKLPPFPFPANINVLQERMRRMEM